MIAGELQRRRSGPLWPAGILATLRPGQDAHSVVLRSTRYIYLLDNLGSASPTDHMASTVVGQAYQL